MFDPGQEKIKILSRSTLSGGAGVQGYFLIKKKFKIKEKIYFFWSYKLNTANSLLSEGLCLFL